MEALGDTSYEGTLMVGLSAHLWGGQARIAEPQPARDVLMSGGTDLLEQGSMAL